MESEPRRLTDGITTLERGCNEGRDRSLLAPNQASRAINLTARGGFYGTRPPVYRVPLHFENAEQSVWFKTHNVQGRCVYEAVNGQVFLIYSVGGRIFRIDPSRRETENNVLELTPLNDPNPSIRRRAWMVQARQYLIIQDGQSTPLIYDGATCRRARLGEPDYEVPVGTVMAYGLGRLVVVRPHRLSYVIGDIANGGTEVTQFTEENYLNEGGDVNVPIPGLITAVKIIAQLDRSTGQGDLIVFTPNGATSAQIGAKRETWKDIQFQQVALLPKGATSQDSVTLVNGDAFMRAPDGIRSLAMTRSEFQNAWGKTPLSREMNRTLSFDTPWLLEFAESALFDNRLFMLCNQSPIPNGCFHRGLIALDFDLISSMDQKSPPAYDGLWTGLKFTSIVAGEFTTGERCFITHRNSDGENELWELLKTGTHDNGQTRIIATLETGTMLRAGSQELSLKRLDGGDVGFQDAVGQVDVEVKFRPDASNCWTPWTSFNICATAPDCNNVCAGGKLQPQYRTKKRFPQPPDTCDTQDNKPARLGYEFQTQLTITGKATISSLRLHAIEQEEPLGGCAVDEVTPAADVPETEHVFAYIADWGFLTNDGQANLVESLVQGWNPEFIVTGGDNRYDATYTAVFAALPYYGSVRDRELMFPGLGNHDTDNSDQIAGFLAAFPYLPGDKRNYEVEQGGCVFFFRETHDSGSHAMTPAELAISAGWLQARLAAWAAARPDLWRVVVTQDPPHTSDADLTDYPGHTASQLDYAGWGAHIVLSGDSHFYERLLVDDFNFIICGASGAPKSDFNAVPVDGSVVRYNTKYGALKGTASCHRLLFEFFNTDGDLIDSLELTR